MAKAKKKSEHKENNEKVEVLKFGAETGKILNLMIHSLYTNKDIFLRELISNSSDACDKLRYHAITQPQLLKENPALKISIKVNDKERTLSITDNGIGMNRQDMIDSIGTIASSGTQKFMEQISGNNQKDVQLIGQFGVGFYSSFMVADKVDVISRKAGEDDAFLWSSDGQGSFELSKISGELPSRGTTIILHLRKDLDEYLDKFRIRHIVSTYSDHISIPIEWINEKDEAEVLNDASAIWTRPKSEITPEQYKEFYKSVAHQPDDPWLIMHNKNEGVVEFTNLLFIPSTCVSFVVLLIQKIFL